MRTKVFVPLALVWPLLFAGLAGLLVADVDPFTGDPRRLAKLAVVALMAWAVALTFGVRDWWKLVMPEEEPDEPGRFVKRTHLLYGLVLAMVAAAYGFVAVIDTQDFRLFPCVVAVIAFAGARGSLNTDRRSGPTTPDVLHSYDTDIPDSVKGRGGKP